MSRSISGSIIIFSICLLVLPQISGSAEWRDEFDEICSSVQVAESLSTDEIQSLLDRSDNLLKQLQSLNNSSIKVYIFRLKKCRKFFQSILEAKSPKVP